MDTDSNEADIESQKVQSDLKTIYNFDDNSSKPKSESNDLMVCCGACSICTLVTSLIGASITYIVFCIIALCNVSLKTTQNRTPGSTLWVYLLVCLIINVVVAKNTKQDKDKDIRCSLFCNIISLIGITSWGTYELWGRSKHDNLDNLLLYTMCEIQVIVSWSIIAILILTVVFMTYKIASK